MIISGSQSQKVDWPSAWVCKFHVHRNTDLLFGPTEQDGLPVTQTFPRRLLVFPNSIKNSNSNSHGLFSFSFFPLHIPHSSSPRNVPLFATKMISWSLFLRPENFKVFPWRQDPPWPHEACHPSKTGRRHQAQNYTTNFECDRDKGRLSGTRLT